MIGKGYYLGVLLFLASYTLGAQNTSEEWFQKGNTAYTNAAYQQAVDAYQAALNTGLHSAELYYNLGNSYYRLNQVASSIYYFEKGLQLAPDDSDLQNNIRFAQNMTLDAIEPLPVTQVTAFKNKLLAGLSLPQWAYLSVVCIWLFFLALLAYIFTKRTVIKKWFFALALVAFSLSLGTHSLGSIKNSRLENETFAIVFSKRIDVSTEPNNRSEVQFALHEGTKVQVLESFQEWQKIRIANGAEGWVYNAELREL